MSCKYCEICGCVSREGLDVVLAPTLPGLIVHDEKVYLTHKEFVLVRRLFQDSPRPVANWACREALYEWGEPESADDMVRQYAFRVNRKLSKHRVHIHCIRDIGYQLIETGKGHD